MVKFYVDRILAGKMNLISVPAKWFDQVKEELERRMAEKEQEA